MPRVESPIKTPSRAAGSLGETKSPDSSEASRAGAELRAAREHLGWELADVAAMLRIRASYLQSLEAGRLKSLPGNVYSVGFLRTYATALGLDAGEVARRFRAEAGEIPHHSELNFPVPMPERGLPAGALILLGLVLAGGVYIGWYRLSGEGRLPAESVPPVPARLAQLLPPPAPVPVPGPTPATPPTTIVAVAAVPHPPIPPSPPPAEDIGLFEPRGAAKELPRPAVAPAAEVRSASIPGATPMAAIAMPLPPPVRPSELQAAPVTEAQASPRESRILLRSTGDTWVRIRQRDGAVVFSQVMKAGDTYAVPDQDNLVLSSGNAGRVEILVDGVEVPPIGRAGAVRTDVALDPEQLKAGSIVPVAGRR